MKNKHYIYAICICVLLFFPLIAFAKLQELPKKELNITFTTPIPPYIYEKEGIVVGSSVQWLNSLLDGAFSTKIQQIPANTITTLPTTHAFLGTMPITENTSLVKAFTLNTIPLLLFYKDMEVTSIENFPPMPIGYVDFGIPKERITEYYPSLLLEEYPTIEQLIVALTNGTIKATILPQDTLSYATSLRMKTLEKPVAYIGLNMYAHKNNTKLLEDISATFIEKLTNTHRSTYTIISYSLLALCILLLSALILWIYKKQRAPTTLVGTDTATALSRSVFLTHFFCTITETGIITSASKGILDTLGYTIQTILGKNISSLQKPSFIPFLLPPKNGMQHVQLLHKNGTSITVAFFPIKTTTMPEAETQYEFIAFNISQVLREQEHAYLALNVYQTIFAESPVGVARYNIDSQQFVHCNPIFETMVHKTSTELNSATLDSVLGAHADALIYQSNVKNIIEKTIALKHLSKETWFLLHASSIHIEDQRYLDIFLINITEWYKEKIQIEEAYSHLQETIDILPDPTFILDANKKIIAWNKALEKLTGVSAKVMLGKDDGSYSLPFYGTIRKMLCDTFYENNTVYSTEEQSGDSTLTVESFCPALGKGKYLSISASLLKGTSSMPTAVIQSMQDITTQKEEMITLEQSKKRYTMVLEATNEGVWEYSLQDTYIQASPKCYEIVELPQHTNVTYTDMLQYVHPEYVNELTSRMLLLASNKIEKLDFSFKIFTTTSKIKWVQLVAFVDTDANGDVTTLVGSLSDITQRKEHENITNIIFLVSSAVNIKREPKELFPTIHSIVKRVVGYTNLMVALWNEKQEYMEYPYYDDENLSQEERIAQISDKEYIPEAIANAFSSGNQVLFTETRTIQGEEKQCVWLATPLKARNSIIGVIATYIVLALDIDAENQSPYSKQDRDLMVAIGEQIAIATERYHAEQQLTAMALHDPLTGLPNRVLFSDRLNHAILRVKRSAEYRFAVFMLDLDRFKLINDTYGHNTGDLLLIEVANRIQPLLRSEDTFARLGGDEFALILENIRSTHEVLAVAKRILRAIERPLLIDGKELRTATSIGIVLEAFKYDSAHELLRDADIAMYDAKTNGKGRFRVFDNVMHAQMLEYVSLENDLVTCIENNQLFLDFQPIIDTKTRALLGFEALVRWLHPERGVIAPSNFIHIAEENGFIVKLGEWVLRESCKVMKSWVDRCDIASTLFMSVNLSAKQAVQGTLTTDVMDIVREVGLNPKQLNLEVTETTIMSDPKNAMKSFNELKQHGVRLSIDDFGSGYSSMTYLQRFPVDTLKIDRTFIHNATSEEGGIEIVRAICALAHSLGLRVVAEGVETEEQLAIVTECSCDSIQGFLFSLPLSQEEALKYLKKAIL